MLLPLCMHCQRFRDFPAFPVFPAESVVLAEKPNRYWLGHPPIPSGCRQPDGTRERESSRNNVNRINDA
jgi:hypothetical protein